MASTVKPITTKQVQDDLAAAILNRYHREKMQDGDVTARMLAERDELGRTERYWAGVLVQEVRAGRLVAVDVMLPNGRRGKAYRRPAR